MKMLGLVSLIVACVHTGVSQTNRDSLFNMNPFGDEDILKRSSGEGIKSYTYANGDSVVILFARPVSLHGFRVNLVRQKIKVTKGLLTSRGAQSMSERLEFQLATDQKTTQVIVRITPVSVDTAARENSTKAQVLYKGAFYSLEIEPDDRKKTHASYVTHTFWYDGKHFIPLQSDALENRMASETKGEWITEFSPDTFRDALDIELKQLPRMLDNAFLF
jgi:hypothetical protein